MHRWVSRIPCLILLICWLVLLPAARVSATVAVTDVYNQPLTISQPPQRVVSLVPGVTEMLLALGLSDRLAGVTMYDRVPSHSGKPAVVGGFFSPPIQAIDRCQPDCIFVADIHQEVQQHFKNMGLPVLYLKAQSVQDIFANLRLVGEMFQRRDQAEELCRQIQAKLDVVQQKTSRIPLTKNCGWCGS